MPFCHGFTKWTPIQDIKGHLPSLLTMQPLSRQMTDNLEQVHPAPEIILRHKMYFSSVDTKTVLLWSYCDSDFFLFVELKLPTTFSQGHSSVLNSFFLKNFQFQWAKVSNKSLISVFLSFLSSCVTRVRTGETKSLFPYFLVLRRKKCYWLYNFVLWQF